MTPSRRADLLPKAMHPGNKYPGCNDLSRTLRCSELVIELEAANGQSVVHRGAAFSISAAGLGERAEVGKQSFDPDRPVWRNHPLNAATRGPTDPSGGVIIEWRSRSELTLFIRTGFNTTDSEATSPIE